MKRGTPGHPKMADLIEALGRRRPECIGYLELLWHFTAKYAPRGDVGRFPDARIEEACEWRGRRGALIEALVSAGWLDRTPMARLLVHDWWQHADDATKKALQRRGEEFLVLQQDTENLSGQCPDTVATTSAPGADKIRLPVPCPALPEPLPEPVPPPAAFCPAPPPSPDLSGIAYEIWQRHPGHRRGTRQSAEHDLAIRCAGAVDPLAVAIAINRTHAECCLSEQWRAGRAMGLTRWLTEDGPGTCMSEPPPMARGRSMSFFEPHPPPPPPLTFEEQCAMWRRTCETREAAEFFAQNTTITEDERAFLLQLAKELPE